MQDYYKLLGVSNFADEAALKGAFRSLALYYHPDVNNSPDAAQKFMEIKLAYDTLIDPTKRATYDYQLRQSHYSPKQPQAPFTNPPKSKNIYINWQLVIIGIYGLFKIFMGSNDTPKSHSPQTYTQQFNVDNQHAISIQTVKPSSSIFIDNKLPPDTAISIATFNTEMHSKKLPVIVIKENDNDLGGYGLKK